MILVNTEDEISKQRNIERGQRGGRTVPEQVRKEKWQNVQNSRPEFAKLFGDKYMEFDNSQDLRNAPPEVVKAKKDEMLQLYTNIKEFVAQPPQTEASQEWVATQMHSIDTLPVPKDGAEKTPHAGSKAAQEAQRLGLQYYGFGRYGKNGEVTYRSVHDTLVNVVKTPTGKPMNKKVNEEFEDFLNEANISKVVSKSKILKDKSGKVKTFMLRSTAASEAHKHGGKLVKVKSGYVIHLEAIDFGIEPGLSMAQSGESPARDTGEKISKKRFGKATQVYELTGDSTTMSIGDQKEDELKKVGISLQSFKAKKFVG
jgi:hypothetical protein